MKRVSKFRLEKTENDVAGGVKIGNGTLKGFRCPDQDGVDFQRYVEGVLPGEIIEVTFSFLMAEVPTIDELASKENKAIKPEDQQ